MASAASTVPSVPSAYQTEGKKLGRWVFFSLLAAAIPMAIAGEVARATCGRSQPAARPWRSLPSTPSAPSLRASAITRPIPGSMARRCVGSV